MDLKLIAWRRYATILLIVCWSSTASAARFRTDNFLVRAPSKKVAEAVARTAEESRLRLSQQWFGKALPDWKFPCQVRVDVSDSPSQGATSYGFRNGRPVEWLIEIEGSLESLIDSVIPHEVSHTVLVSHFCYALPRWADEGAAILSENPSEQQRQRLVVSEIIESRQHLPLRKILAMKEYPRDPKQILDVYSLGFSLSEFLVLRKGRKSYLMFLSLAETSGWDAAIHEVYHFENVENLEKSWIEWVRENAKNSDVVREGIWVESSIPGHTVSMSETKLRELDSAYGKKVLLRLAQQD